MPEIKVTIRVPDESTVYNAGNVYLGDEYMSILCQKIIGVEQGADGLRVSMKIGKNTHAAMLAISRAAGSTPNPHLPEDLKCEDEEA